MGEPYDFASFLRPLSPRALFMPLSYGPYSPLQCAESLQGDVSYHDVPFNVHSKGKVCGASPLCFFLPSSLLLHPTDVITLCSESLHLSIPDAALIFPPDGKQNRDGMFDSDLIPAFVQLTAQLETAQHQSGMFNHVQWYALDTHMQGKESATKIKEARWYYIYPCMFVTQIEGSLASIEGRFGAVCFGSHYIRLAMCTRPLLFSANLFKPSPAWGRGTRKLNAFHVVTHAPTQTLLRARCQPKLYSSSEPTFHPHFTDMFTVGLRLLTRLPVVFPAFSEL
ncbi:hypothetical protein B0H14DRAFT_3133233 [Mycena olivaceomarginata]|nr:hypothetical protein B0H14DRAFT_3133233 [Mycena olivaceomarginata]